MDERELTSRIKALNKAVAANEPPAGILSLMATLKNMAAPSEEMLRSTKAGHVVGKMRAHANPEIKSLASEIVGKWKKAVESEKAKKHRAAKMASPASTPGGTGTGTASPAPPSSVTTTTTTTTTTTVYKGDPEKRSFKVDGVDTDRTTSAIRNGSISLLYNGLCFRSTEPVDAVLVKAMEVERAAYTAYKGETAEYRAKLRSLFQNLKNRANPALARRVMSGEIAADKFVTMDSSELKSAELRKLEEDLQQENMKKAQVPTAEKSISDALTCGKCKQKKVSYTQAQTRSADEPMTTFCECTVCGNRWKFS